MGSERTRLEQRFYQLLGEGVCLVCSRKLKDHDTGLSCAEVGGRRLVVNPKGQPPKSTE